MWNIEVREEEVAFSLPLIIEFRRGRGRKIRRHFPFRPRAHHATQAIKTACHSLTSRSRTNKHRLLPWKKMRDEKYLNFPLRDNLVHKRRELDRRFRGNAVTSTRVQKIGKQQRTKFNSFLVSCTRGRYHTPRAKPAHGNVVFRTRKERKTRCFFCFRCGY